MAGTVAAIGLGSNVGDRKSHLDFACDRLERLLSRLRISTFHETAPIGVSGPQPDFLNAVAVGETDLAPRALLEALQAIERERGRERPFPNAPRTLDLDLVLFGDQVIDEPGLQVPHPRFRERAFVLVPLVEVAPGLEDPVTGKSARELLGALLLGR